jgi:hypothetical protein
VPIRTRRGRAAAYRSVWEWPLQSPARLFACLTALVVVVVAISVLSGTLGGSSTAPSSRGGGTAAPASPAEPGSASASAQPAAPELVPTTLPLRSAPPGAVQVAERWTQAWARHPPGTTPLQWSSGLAPYTTEEYLAVLSSVDPANVPGTRVTGPAQVVEVRADAVRIQVPTDAVRLELLLVQVAPGDWRVSGYDGAS